ncbi:sugar ABC transporter permease [Quadrisphaera sp. RL12-1S]|nr:sugar ABC transporter permease [Quadrisphaera sp. RL12-1S]MBC3760627.1 sugar ABC transporter permease [Quadrisphaera sp. RL12-1S]
MSTSTSAARTSGGAPSRARQIGELVSSNLRQFGMVIALVLLLLFFQVQTGVALTPGNIINIIQGNAYVLILAVGMVLVIIAGHIDLSVGSVAAFVGVVVAKLIQDGGVPPYLAILLGLAVAILVGAWQGFWVAVVGIPAFIVTLAGMLLFRGLNQVLGQSTTIPVPQQIIYFGTASLPEVGPNTGFNNLTVLLGLLGLALLVFVELRKRRNALRLGAPAGPVGAVIAKLVLLGAAILVATYLFASAPVGRSFPIAGIVLLLLVVVYAFVAAKTPLGRHIYAVGGNRAAAVLTGVNVRRVNFFVMTNMGFLAGVAAVVFIGRSTSSGPADGVGWELDAIAAVFIGGAAVSGGIGTVVASVIGGLVIAVLNNGLQLLGVQADITQVIKGLVLLLAVALDVYNKSQGKPSIIGLVMRGLRRDPRTGQDGPPPAQQPAAEPPLSSTRS